MATFASEYCVLPKNEKAPNQIELKNNLRFILRRTQTQFAVVRYMRFSLEKQQEDHLLQLFLRCRTDLDLKPEGFELFYEADDVRLGDGRVHSVKDWLVGSRQVVQLDRNTKTLSRSEGLTLVHSLNETQKAIFHSIRRWCLDRWRRDGEKSFNLGYSV